MKMTKRIAASVAALTMAVSVMTAAGAMTAIAAPSTPTYSITLGTTSQTYTYYQIFKGTYSDGKLLDEGLKFGSGVNETALKRELGLESDATAADALAEMDGMEDSEILSILKPEEDDVLGSGTTLTSGTTTTVDQGYYYILEEEDDASADILMIVDGEETITPKLGAPKVEKKIKENVRIVSLGEVMDEDLYETGFNDTADYCIGDSIPFEVVGSMPENIDSYNNYYYEFTDRLGKGFVKPAESAIKVYLDGTTDITSNAVIKITQEDTSKPTTISIKFANIKAAGTITKDSKIVVKYSAKLDTDAVIGNAGNTNGVKLTYSTNLNYDGTTTPGGDDVKDTPEDGVVAFTYTLDTTKVDQDDNTVVLEGAKFKLLNSDKDKAAKVTDGKFAGWADDVASGTELTTADDGKYTVVGLDAGIYFIIETEAPDGYNKLKKEVQVTVNAQMNTLGNWDYAVDNGTDAFDGLTTDSYFVPDATAGTITGNIENAQGAELPETGGIGTTLFYVGGGAMAAAAGIVLVVRKRAKKEK